MENRVSLPSGGWLELRDPDEITERARRKVTNTIGRLSDKARAFAASRERADMTPQERDAAALGAVSEADMDTFDRMNDLLAEALIARWSFEGPVDAETMPDLPRPVYRAIQEAVAPFISRVMELDTSPSREPDSPTEPSFATDKR